MNTIRKALIISIALLATHLSLRAGGPVTPRYRITEIDKLPQHLKVQQEIYDYINELVAFQNNNYPLFAEDTLAADSGTTIYLSDKYLTATSFVVIPVVRSGAAHAISVDILSDSSFTVKGDSASLPFQWLAIGVKK